MAKVLTVGSFALGLISSFFIGYQWHAWRASHSARLGGWTLGGADRIDVIDELRPAAWPEEAFTYYGLS